MDLQGAITDAELLSRYLREGDEHAFAALARRHERMVIGTAWRHLGDADLARDIAQQVFATLARKAALLTSRASLAGWLHIAATHIAARTRSAEETRRARQGQAAAQTPDRRDGNDGAQLEEALASLSESEREALVLHYFEDRSYAEMASALGLQEAAVRKRVSRALESLGAKLRRRGFCGSAVTALVGASAIQSGLPVTIAAGATLALPAVASSSFALTITTLMGNTAFKIAAAVALASTLPIAWQSHANSKLQAELIEARRTTVASTNAQVALASDADPLRAEFAALAARLAEIRRAGEETKTRLAESQQELDRIQQEVLVRFGKTEDLARTIAAKLEDILPIVGDLEKKQPLDSTAKERVERITKAAIELLPLFGQLRQLEEEPEQAARFTAMVFGDVLKLTPETRTALEIAVGEGYADLKRNGLTLSSRPKDHNDAWVERRASADRALTARVLATLPEDARKLPMVKMLGRYSGILLPPEIALLGGFPGGGGMGAFLKANPVKPEPPRPSN